MVDKWKSLMRLILDRNDLSTTLYGIINQIQNNSTRFEKTHENQIVKGIETLIQYNTKLTEVVTSISKSEYKMLFMVATVSNVEVDEEGKSHIVSRKKKGFVFDSNDYYMLEDSQNYLQRDLTNIKNQFITV